ncbi:MAG: GTPase HflX [Deltaproteobacteria bacterium]|nr:GTPase HflX [Deltaproteobacteria bacterium]
MGNAFPQRPSHQERMLLVGVRRPHMSVRDMQRSLDELVQLVGTAGGEVAAVTTQQMKTISAHSFLGSGKVDELKKMVHDEKIDAVVVDDQLTAVQNRNLEEALTVRVLDRPSLILDVFALRARSHEGKLQVELAQLQYIAPRLVGRGEMLSQQAGGIGTRGPGETALEVDRRRIRERMTLLRRRLDTVRAERDVQREKRLQSSMPLVSLVGYTNAGKSTLLNALSHADALVEDKLFATLDPLTRRVKLPTGREILLADTVGFIERLPHELIEAFRATFEEISYAHLLLHVIDLSDENMEVKYHTVERVLHDLGLTEKPTFIVLNKSDAGHAVPRFAADGIKISALHGQGLDELLRCIDAYFSKHFVTLELLLPHTRGDVLSELYRCGYIREVRHEPEGIIVQCSLLASAAKKFSEFIQPCEHSPSPTP